MDTAYIQLCAEMAYNEVIMENYFNEANEDNKKEGLGKRIANMFKTIGNFIKRIWNKIVTFITEKYQEISKKIKEKFDKSKEEDKKETKDEKVEESFTDSILRMVLTESEDDIYGIDINKVCNIITGENKYIIRLLDASKKYIFSKIDDAQDKIFNNKNSTIDGTGEFINDGEITYAKYQILSNISNDFSGGGRSWSEDNAYNDAFNSLTYKDIQSKCASKGEPRFNRNDIDNALNNIAKEIKQSGKYYQDLEAKCAAEVKKVENAEFDSQLLAKYIHLNLNVLQKLYSVGSSAIVRCYSYLTKACTEATSYLIKYEKYEKYKSTKYKPSF